ncbi:hypothetical protein OG302_09860 [Streptomyces sp. NBC_01283]|uniref:hypothetical protein n=1 Tax=Streptomyces sp. NBC_01283 TaxID=2903812 RepID=UPI00352C315D|nr:hypothetical protein OG302_09860 [Streptomyces sp. NBC_01283]
MPEDHVRKPKIDRAFRVSDGQPVEFEGKTVHLAFGISMKWATSRLAIAFTSSVSKPPQGVCLELSEGDLLVNGSRSSGVCLWADSAPPVVYLEPLIKPTATSTLQVWNCWRGGDGEPQMWRGNAGLLVDLNPGASYRFSCSDGTGQADFTDLIFGLEIQEKTSDPWLKPLPPRTFTLGTDSTHPRSANT